jgi:hypothetical protein
MGSVYAYATITIAAVVAKDSTVGLLKKSKAVEPHFEIDIDSTSGKEDALLISPKSQKVQRVNGEEDFVSCHQYGVLAPRGWTLQGRVLSTRMLHYGAS